jgi:prepilin-type N-terminal cleavage/methylation domain-containing protein
MKVTDNSPTGSKSRHGFTLVEMIGVLSVISILASLLVPRVFQAINDSRVAAAAASYNGVKSAVNEYFGRFGLLGGANGATINIANNAAFEEWDLNVLVSGGFMERPFMVKLGNGLVGLTDDGSRLRLINISDNGPTTDPASVAADLAQGAYDLDGSGGATDNDIIGGTVVEAVINGVEEKDARDLSLAIDGPSLAAAAAAGSADTKGRVKYLIGNDGLASIRIYVAHK